MKEIKDLVITYLLRMKNAGLTSIRRADLRVYLASVGVKDVDQKIFDMLRRGHLIELSTGKLTLNLVRLRKKRKK